MYISQIKEVRVMRELIESVVLGIKFLFDPKDAFKNPATAMLWVGSWTAIVTVLTTAGSVLGLVAWIIS